MKQNITLDQLNELSEKGKGILDKWFFEKGYYDEEFNHGLLLSIGQMLEFLIEHDAIQGAEYGQPTLPSYQDWQSYPDMIRNDLWREVKQILEQ